MLSIAIYFKRKEKREEVIMTYGYCRVSTVEQDNEKFQNEILKYSNKNDLGKVEFVEEKKSGKKDWRTRELGTLINDKCKSGDIILVPELSRISRSISQTYDIITVCQSKDITLHFLKQNLIIKKENDMTTKVMLNTMSMVSEMERDFISLRTKESLSVKKNNGVKLGRPRGTGKSKLDQFSEEIKSFRKNGPTITWLGKHYGVSTLTVSNWLKKHNVG